MTVAVAPLVDEPVAEERAHEAILARNAQRKARLPGVEALLAQVERRIGRERVACLRDEYGRWEARTFGGDSGHGDTLAEALSQLLAEIPA